MRVLFLSTPQSAHLDWGGYLPTARQLQTNGHNVLWVSGAAIASQVTEAGVPFTTVSETGWRLPSPLPSTNAATSDASTIAHQRQLRAFDTWLDVENVSAAVETIEPIARAFDPDCIVTEMFCAASALIAERLARPLVVAGWPALDTPLAESPLSIELQGRVRELCRRFDCIGVNFAPHMPALQSPHLHITWWNPRWYAGIPLLPQTRHAGGIAPAPQPIPTDFPDPAQKPWVLITLGTTYNRDNAFFRMATHAAVQMGCQPIVAHGRLSADELSALRAEIAAPSYLAERVDFAAILPHCVAAIHHGGAGTTHALVTQGIPQIVIPHAGDQGFQARAVARCAIGVHIPAREATLARIQSALAAILPDRSTFRSNARNLVQEFAALGGVATSAKLIESVMLEA